MSLAVVFHSQGVRILKGVDPKDFEACPNVVLDPGPFPRGVAPHHWKLVEGKIVPMEEDERIARDIELGLDTKNTELKVHTLKFTNRHFWEIAIVSAAVSTIISMAWLSGFIFLVLKK